MINLLCGGNMMLKIANKLKSNRRTRQLKTLARYGKDYNACKNMQNIKRVISEK